MKNKIDEAIYYYQLKGQEILDIINSKSELNADQIIYYGEEMAKIEYKITALEVAKEN